MFLFISFLHTLHFLIYSSFSIFFSVTNTHVHCSNEENSAKQTFLQFSLLVFWSSTCNNYILDRNNFCNTISNYLTPKQKTSRKRHRNVKSLERKRRAQTKEVLYSTYIYTDHITEPEHSQDTHTTEQKPSSHEKITSWQYWTLQSTRVMQGQSTLHSQTPRFDIITVNLFSLTNTGWLEKECLEHYISLWISLGLINTPAWWEIIQPCVKYL